MMKPGGTYEAVIGLEVHAQMLTASKAFCGCTTKFGNEPNSNVCPVCLGLPGVLPVLNKQVVEYTIRMGLATHCTIAPRSIFARKNYFYPDLPKGYQISQYEEPICTNGYVEIDLDDGTQGKIGLTRVHMEEDAGKSIHDQDVDTLVDVNRCGVPLIEIVSEPDIRSPREAYLYMQKVRQIVTYLGICDGNMEEGSLRCDANVSVRKKGEIKFGTKTEVKNMNSFRFVERALEFEINRQIQILEEGGMIGQETLLWDANQNVAQPMRSKEEAHDYRYFPEPDLVPVLVDQKWIDRIRKTLPEHPTVRRDRFISEYGLPKHDADILTSQRTIADGFEKVIAYLITPPDQKLYKMASNWTAGKVLGAINEGKLNDSGFLDFAPSVSGLIDLVAAGTINLRTANEIFDEAVSGKLTREEIDRLIERKGLAQLSDESAIEKTVVEVLENSKAQVEKYRSGNEKVFGFFVGEVMKATGGKANPKIVNDVLKRHLTHG